ncbi:MAG: GDP-mannose 4,6-dehydratase [Isosphaeraceae bacterium]
MKWVITGGAGFIGCHAAARFHRQGHQVVVVDDLSRRGAEANLAWLRDQGVHEFARLDVRDFDGLRALMTRHADADAVLHLAAQVAVTTSVTDPRHDFEVNALGTFNVLEAVRSAAGGKPAVLYSSTNKVYGNLEHVKVVERDGRYAYEDLPNGVDESEPLDFHSPYGCSKGCGDQYVRDYARIYGLKTVALRQSCVYGTRQFGIEDQGWVAWFCVAVTTGQPFTIYGDGKQIRDVLWVEDLVDLYERAAERADAVKGEVFNVGGGPANTMSLRELVARLERRFGRALNPPFADWRPGDQRVFVADVRKAERLLGWRPRVTVDQGVDRLIDWVRENRALFA